MFKNIGNCLCVLLLLAGRLDVAFADAISDDEAAIAVHIKALRDTDQEKRAVAAEALRRIVAKYPSKTTNLRNKNAGEAAWQEKASLVMTKADARKFLPRFAEESDGMEIGSGDSHLVAYRLDYNWMVTISFRNTGKVIERPTLTRRALRVWVAPPKGFTGKWVTWHVNGQKAHEIDYTNGKYDGLFTTFHDNGGRSVEQHYVNHQGHGADTGWYADGKLSYTAFYRNGKQDGKWTHYYGNGIKHSEMNYSDGKYEGLNRRWYESGKLNYEARYRKGVKHGREASWDENGELQYEHDYVNGMAER